MDNYVHLCFRSTGKPDNRHFRDYPNRTCCGHAKIDANDPKATFGFQLASKTCCNRAVDVREGNPARRAALTRQIVSVREK